MMPGCFGRGMDGSNIYSQQEGSFTTKSANSGLVESGLGFDSGEDGFGLDQVETDGIEVQDEGVSCLDFSFNGGQTCVRLNSSGS